MWDVTDLAPGTYYVYAVIADARGSGQAYAPGAVVIPHVPPTGSLVVTAGTDRLTSESGKTATFRVRLGSAPTGDVVVPLASSDPGEGRVAPPSLSFTPLNWNVPQTVTVTGRNDCAPDGSQAYRIMVGKAVSADPDYMGVEGTPVELVNLENIDIAGSTDHADLHLCGMTVLREKRINLLTWEYTLTAELTNTGPAVGGVTARLARYPITMKPVEGFLSFGAVDAGDTAKTGDTVTVRSLLPVPAILFNTNLVGFRWTVTEQP